MIEPLVVFDNVVKRFGDFVAVKEFDLEIKKGEFLAIMGPSGCGKTTTLRMLAGLEQPSAGEIRLSARRMNEVKPSERDTPMVWQTLALFPFLNVLKNKSRDRHHHYQEVFECACDKYQCAWIENRIRFQHHFWAPHQIEYLAY